MRVTDPDEAAGHLRRTDTLGIPLGPGQPAAFLDALGRRMDWEELRISGALLTVITELFSHPNVHYLSGFYGPIERLLRDSGANISFAPADFRRFIPLMAAYALGYYADMPARAVALARRPGAGRSQPA